MGSPPDRCRALESRPPAGPRRIRFRPDRSRRDRQQSLACEIQEVKPGRANLLARLGPRGARPHLIFNGHADTVPAGGGWTHDPHGGEIADGRLYGRGAADMKSEIERFPRLFQAVESIPGLTWPTLTFRGEMTLWLGKLEVRIMQLGRGHTKGDTVVWLPRERIMLSGDLVEFGATPYAGDAYFSDWPQTLDAIAALKPAKLVPGRGAALTTEKQVQEGLAGTRAFISELFATIKPAAAAGKDLRTVYREAYDRLKPRYGNWVIFDHCMPFDVTRAYDEATRYRDPRIWTAQRDKEMWDTLEGASAAN